MEPAKKTYQTFNDAGIELKSSARTGRVKLPCPECGPSRKNHHDPCLSVHVGQGVWRCHHCGWKGGLIGASMVEKKKEYAPAPIVKPVITDKVLAYINARGISLETMKAYGVGSARIWMPPWLRSKETGEQMPAGEQNVIVFPYALPDGTVVNHQYRSAGKSFRMDKDAQVVPFGMQVAADHIKDRADTKTKHALVITEGQFDCMAFYEAGIAGVISVPNGSPKMGNTILLEWIEEILPFLDLFDEYILATDADGPGENTANELARRLGKHKCRRSQFPDTCKDANEALLQFGKEAVRDLKHGALPYPMEAIEDLDSLLPDIHRLLQEGWPKGPSIGIAGVDELFSPRPSQLVIVTGAPGSGKSDFMDFAVTRWSHLHDWKAAFFSPERDPAFQHMLFLMEVYSGLYGFSPSPHNKLQGEYLKDAEAWARDRYFMITTQDGVSTSVDHLIERIEELVTAKGIRVAVIDPWNKIEHLGDPAKDQHYVSKSLRDLKSLAKRRDILIVLMAHPRKLQPKPTGGYMVPTPYDISGFAEFYNQADWCIALDKRKNEDDDWGHAWLVDLHIQKAKFANDGREGRAELRYDRTTRRYAGSKEESFISTQQERWAAARPKPTNTYVHSLLDFTQSQGERTLAFDTEGPPQVSPPPLQPTYDDTEPPF